MACAARRRPSKTAMAGASPSKATAQLTLQPPCTSRLKPVYTLGFRPPFYSKEGLASRRVHHLNL